MPDQFFAWRRSIIAATFLLVTSTVMALGAVRYVAPTGNDSNPGTLAQPYRTIQKCATTVAPHPRNWRFANVESLVDVDMGHVWTAPTGQGIFLAFACGRVQVMCPACLRGAHDRWP